MGDSSPTAAGKTSTQPATTDAAAASAAPAPSASPAVPAKTDPAPAPASVTNAQSDPAKPAGDTAKPAAADAAKPAADAAAKPADDAAAKAAADAAAKAAPVIPEKYDLKPPEGVEALDAPLLEAVTPLFKEAGLTNEAAQKIVNTFIEAQKAAPARMLARDLEILMKDPVLGQMNIGKTQGYVNAALTAFMPLADRQALERAGLGNRLEFVRFVAAVGKAMGSDQPARGSPASAEKPSTASKLYGGGDLVQTTKAN